MKLIDEIIELLGNARNLTDWDLANLIYDNCMNMPNKSNGARISNIKRACFKSDKIECFHGNNESFNYFLKKELTVYK